jgi:hypothetical protein
VRRDGTMCNSQSTIIKWLHKTVKLLDDQRKKVLELELKDLKELGDDSSNSAEIARLEDLIAKATTCVRPRTRRSSLVPPPSQ